MDAARTTAGVTLGTGEGGNAFGYRFFIRGFDTRNDVFIETLTARGSFNFGSAPGGAYTGNGLLDFLQGYIASASVGIAPLHGQPKGCPTRSD